jgi:acetyl esterase/lipase
VTELDSEVRELLDRWAARPVRPVSELTAEAVREDDLAALDLQWAPGELYSVEHVEAPGPAGTVPEGVYRPRRERLHPVLFLHGGGFVIGRDDYDAPLAGAGSGQRLPLSDSNRRPLLTIDRDE